jgi:hypothetical protein
MTDGRRDMWKHGELTETGPMLSRLGTSTRKNKAIRAYNLS